MSTSPGLSSIDVGNGTTKSKDVARISGTFSGETKFEMLFSQEAEHGS